MPGETKHHACAECKEKKLRCVPGDDDSDRCHRCTRLGRECRLPEVKRRTRKAKLRGRVEQLESSYSEILSLLKRPIAAIPGSGSGSGSGPGSDCPPLSISDVQSQSQSHSQATDMVTPPRGLGLASYTGTSTTTGIGVDDLTLGACEGLINNYRRMSALNFGYVIVPEACSARALIEERPLLARAIFIVTSWRNPARLAALQAAFVRELSDRYFVKAERSLDLLQALMVYFGWCHWYPAPFPLQAYRLATLIATMAVELGITQRPTNMTQHDMIVGAASAFTQANETVSSKFWCYEARRAYIGAYHISTFCLLLFRRPVLLPHTPYLDECVSSLAADPQYPSDTTLTNQVGSMRLAEQVSLSFDHGSRERFAELSDDKVHMLVKTLVKHLDDNQTSLPMAVSDNGALERLYHLRRAYIHEVGLYGLLQGQTPSVTRISIIYECYTSAMRFLSSVLDLSLQEMADWTSMDWRGLNLAVMLCTKSSIILDAAYCSTTAEASQRAAWLYKCLDTLCVRAKDLNGQRDAPPGQDHCLKRMAGEWSTVKIYHQTCIQRGLSATNPTTTHDHTTTNTTVPTSGSGSGVNMNHTPVPSNGPGTGTHIPPAAHQFFDNSVFEMDSFNDIFWAGLPDPDGSMGMYQM